MRPGRFLGVVGCSFPVFLVLAAGLAGARAQTPVRIADEVVETIATPEPYPRSSDPALPAWTHTLHWPDATFIAAHFERFDLAPGDRLVLTDPKGTVRHAYDAQGLGGRGGKFWGLSVAGDTMLLELYTTSPGGTAHAGIAIDRWTHGLPAAAFAPEAICGTDDARDHECYRTSHPTEFQKARAAVKLLLNGSSHCTGWIASCQNHIMTNEHCVGSQGQLDDIEFQFEYRRPSCGSGTPAPQLQLQGGTLLEVDAPLDYALIMPALAGNDPQATYGFLQWDPRLPALDEKIYIPGHPSGRPKQLALTSTHPNDSSGRCEIWSTSQPACSSGGPPDIGYYCDTEGGSSGSAVLSAQTHKVIALHHCANCPNRGVPILEVYEDIQASAHPLPGCVICDPGPAPTGTTASAPENNRVRVSWNAVPGATRYRVYRSRTGCGGSFALVGSTVTKTFFVDTEVSGGFTYTYKVTADNACGAESAASNCADALAFGRCLDAPLFAGLVSATNSKAGACGVDLAWAPASPRCGGAVRYNVYSATSAGFVPGPENRIASCVAGTSWRDTGLRDATTAFYVVRAEDDVPGGDGSCAGGNEDANRVERVASTSGPDDVFYAAGFEASEGWTVEGEWQTGAPQGRGGSAAGGSGSPDPSSAFSGTGVLGVDLTGLGPSLGNYEDNIETAQYATSPAFSGAGKTRALLRFQRWLGVETSTYDRATLDVFDGTSWQNVYTNPASSFSDGAWTAQEYDVTSRVAGKTNARLRFGISTDTSVKYCGWNVDRLEVYQPTSCATGAVGVPPVGDGARAGGAPMIARRGTSGATVVLSWDAARCPVTGYHLFHGGSASLASYGYAGAVCNIGTTGNATVTIPNPPVGQFTWWTLAGASGATESHHGFRSTGAVRPASGVGFCGITTHDAAGSCP